MLEKVHRHESRRVGLPDDRPVDLDAEQTQLEDVLAGAQVRHVGLLSLARELRGPAQAGSHSLGPLVDVFDGPAAEQPAELGLQLLYLLLPAVQLVLVRLHLPVQILVDLIGAGLLLHERRPEVGALMLLELEQLLRLLELLNLVGVRLAQTPELGSQCSLVHVVVLVHNQSLSATLGTLTLLPGRAAHLHEHLDLIVRRLELHLHPGDVDTEPIAL